MVRSALIRTHVRSLRLSEMAIFENVWTMLSGTVITTFKIAFESAKLLSGDGVVFRHFRFKDGFWNTQPSQARSHC